MRTGTLIAANSGYANDNPFRFSTKWLDDELAATGQTGAVGEEGLYYYGYRYLSTTWGRWLNRDPIGESGGKNLYAFVRNRPTGLIDMLGLEYDEVACDNCVQQCLEHYPGQAEHCAAYTCESWCSPDEDDASSPKDLIELYCDEVEVAGINSRQYHCDVKCTRAAGGGVLWGGGSGPYTSGTESYGGKNDEYGNPRWITGGPVMNGQGTLAGTRYAPPGTCDCIDQKGQKLNKIKGKLYELPPLAAGNISNSNALLSTLLGCCGVQVTPVRKGTGSNLWAPGWGDSVERTCGGRCYDNAMVFWMTGLPLPPKICKIGCKDLN